MAANSDGKIAPPGGATTPTLGRRGPLLVTGAHRSGTTWVGRMLGAADELHYVQEPFNIVSRQRWLGARPPQQFFHLHDSNAASWGPRVQRVLGLRYPFVAHVRAEPTATSARLAARIVRDARRARRSGASALLKDPIALFSTAWLAKHFGVAPVILVRDAVSFVGSLKARNWTFDFRHWSGQPALMAGPIAEHGDRVAAMATADPLGGAQQDIVEQGIVQWNAMYAFVDQLRHDDASVVVRRYETPAADPQGEMPLLFEQLGLRFGAAQQAVVDDLSSGSSNGRSAIDVRRNSRTALVTWKGRLTPSEIERVRAATRSVADRFGDLP